MQGFPFWAGFLKFYIINLKLDNKKTLGSSIDAIRQWAGILNPIPKP